MAEWSNARDSKSRPFGGPGSYPGIVAGGGVKPPLLRPWSIMMHNLLIYPSYNRPHSFTNLHFFILTHRTHLMQTALSPFSFHFMNSTSISSPFRPCSSTSDQWTRRIRSGFLTAPTSQYSHPNTFNLHLEEQYLLQIFLCMVSTS